MILGQALRWGQEQNPGEPQTGIRFIKIQGCICCEIYEQQLSVIGTKVGSDVVCLPVTLY